MTTTANLKTVRKMSDMVICCELRAAYADVEMAIRHGNQPGRVLSDYVAALTAEQKRRAA
jgi:hypothetical protein